MKQLIKGFTKIVRLSSLTIVITTIIGCAATQTVIEHRNLETNTRLSKTIFLDPVSDQEKTIFIVVKNTSDQDMNIHQKLSRAFKNKGYRVTKDLNEAHYLLQANILQVGKMSTAASQSALGGGYGSSVAGGLAGGGLAAAITQNSSAIIASGVAGGLAGIAADAVVKNVNYTMITDVQISEKHPASFEQSAGSKLKHVSSRQTQYERYRTRIVSNASKFNLSFTEAAPSLEAGLVKTLVGIF